MRNEILNIDILAFCNLQTFLAYEDPYDTEKKIGRPHLEKLLEKTIDKDEVTVAPKLTIKHVDVKHQESSMPTVWSFSELDGITLLFLIIDLLQMCLLSPT